MQGGPKVLDNVFSGSILYIYRLSQDMAYLGWRKML